MLYYESFRWYKDHHGDEIEFVSDTKVRLNEHVDGWSVCLLENEISKQFCRKFSIRFKIVSFGEDGEEPDFFVGYATGNSIENSVLDWQSAFGEGGNSDTSWGWVMYTDRCSHYGDGHKLERVADSIQYSKGDIVTLVFDFIKRDA